MSPLISVAAIFLLLIVSVGLVIGITYAPCYATLCSEDYFPLETRLHLATFYTFLGLTSCMLLLRTFNDSIRSFSGIHLSPQLPLLRKRITVGGVAISFWTVLATLATSGFWIPAHFSFWGSRTDPLGWDSAKIRLTITGVTGHYADILIGLLIIPVSRNSLMGRAFGLHQGVLLFAHKLIAYLFLAATLAHGIAYGLYALDPSSDGDEARNQAFATGNPAMTLAESEQRGSWYTNTTYTGAATLVLLIIITLTALPYIRRRFYNVFYYCHIITSICIFVAAIAHASTDLYLLLPGLFLWITDWTIRVFGGEAGGLHKTHMATVEDAGSGWFRISLPALKGYDNEHDSVACIEDAQPSGYPLMCYYLNLPMVSRIQNHAFTAAASGSMSSGPTFLFQRTQGKRSSKSLAKEWTWKLAALASSPGHQRSLKVRVEGPYSPADRGFEMACHIICIVGGTGITGALSLAVWWSKSRAQNDESKFTLVWTVRHEEMANVQEWLELKHMARSMPKLRLVSHISSQSQRLDPLSHIKQSIGLDCEISNNYAAKRDPSERRTAWVYSSGPVGLIRATEKACIEAQRDIRRTVEGGNHTFVDDLAYYMAKWEV